MSTFTNRMARWATIDNVIDTITTIIAALGVLFVAVAGIVLSFNALWELARLSGAINPALTWLWPLTLDALAVVASLNVLWSETRKEHDTYAWSLVIAFTVLSVLFNAAHASLNELLALHALAPVLVAGFVGILPPVAAAFALHLLVRLLRQVLERVSVMAAITTLIAQAEQKRQELDALSAEAERKRTELGNEITTLIGKIETLRSELEELRRQKRQEGDPRRPQGAETSDDTKAHATVILAERGDISGAELGRLLNKSESLGRRLKRELWPEVAPTFDNGRQA